MKQEKIPVKFDRLDTIYHLADIHIRNVWRHKEYRQVFENVYRELEKDTTNAVTVVAGDIVHAKLELSPESVDLTFEFFKKLAEIMPTFIVTGNHDCNLNNRHRMDALSPFVKNIDNPNLFYLRDSGVYDVADSKIVIMSVFDEPEDYIKAKDIQGDTKIAIYHGIVHKAVSDLGFSLHNERVKSSVFDGYDITLLGDIHKHQYLNEQRTIAFCGSLIQQNHGELLEHGLLKWNVPGREAEFVSIHNEYGYVTLIVDEGKMPVLENIPPKARIRLKVRKTPPSRITEIMTEIRKRYPKVEEISDVRINDVSEFHGIAQMNKLDIGDVRDVNFQNELIREFLTRNYSVDEETLTEIFNLNSEFNSKLPPREYQRNIMWKPRVFEFSNLFSYGEGNKLDFTKLKGIVGLFAPNTSGKSNLIEALSFTMFDKSPRAWKAINAMNNKKDKYSATITFDIAGKEYKIKRNAEKNKKGDVNVKTDFSVKESTGKKKSLNGDRRNTTNTQIKTYVGSFDDWILISPMGGFSVVVDVDPIRSG